MKIHWVDIDVGMGMWRKGLRQFQLNAFFVNGEGLRGGKLLTYRVPANRS